MFVAAFVLASLPTVNSEAEPGVLYLTADVSSESSSETCGAITNYFMTPLAPTTGTSQKAYLPEITFACAFFFDYPVTQAFTLEGAASVKMWLFCDLVAANTGSPGTVEFRFYLHNGDTQISEFVSQVNRQCTLDPIEYAFALATGDTEFAVGDVLRLRVLAFWPGTGQGDVENLFFYVGSTEYPSSITAAGLPGGAPALPSADMTLDLPETATVTDGSANVTGSLTNNAAANDSVAFGLEDVPEGWTVEVRVGGNATENLTVQGSSVENFEVAIANALTPGDYNFTLKVTSTLGFAQARQINVTVPAVDPTPTTSAAPATSTPSATSSSAASAAAVSDDPEATPGPGAVMTGIVSIALVGIISRRRR